MRTTLLSPLSQVVAAYLEQHPGATAKGIARGLGVRTADVVAALRSGPFVYTLQGRQKLWRNAVSAGERFPSRPASQCDRILEVLADGCDHSTAEILRRVPCIVHSRIAELRSRGFVIDHWTDGVGAAGSHYRLVTSERVAA